MTTIKGIYPMLRLIRLSHSFVILMALVVVQSCAPLPYVYYEPSATGGKLVHSLCAQFAPKDTIELQIEGIKARITVGDTLMLINIIIPEDTRAQFTTDEILLYEDKPENANHFKIVKTAYYDSKAKGYVTIQSTDSMVGAKFGIAGERLFEISVQLDGKERKHFFVQLPDIRAGEQLHRFPVIEFEKKTGVGIMPINC